MQNAFLPTAERRRNSATGCTVSPTSAHDAFAMRLGRWLRADGHLAFVDVALPRHPQGLLSDNEYRGQVYTRHNVRSGPGRPDVVWLDRRNKRVRVVEVKVTRSDLLADLRMKKWTRYRQCAGMIYFASPPDIIRPDDLPPKVGWITETKTGFYIKKRASVSKPMNLSIEQAWGLLSAANRTLPGSDLPRTKPLG